MSPSDSMPGAIAVIYFPDTPVEEGANPAKYDLTAQSAGGVNLSPQQTLMDVEAFQNETHTYMKFTKFLEEEGEEPVLLDSPTNFIYAASTLNGFGYHSAGRGAFQLQVSQCTVPTTLLTAVVDTPELSTLETAAVLAGEPVTGPLGDTSLSLTAFAPNDDAFTAAGLDAYLEPDFILHLRDLLLYHVHGAEILAADIPGGETELTMLNGASDVVTVRGGRVVTVTDTQGNRYDVIAPDAAIVDNGVAHIIDGVLLPSWAGMGVATAAGMVERFSILAQAVTAAGLGETLDNTMGITVFAPNNDAFAAALPGLGFESADELLAETELLTSVLQYHAIAVVARSEILTDGMMVDSLLEGESLTINVGEGVTVNGISVVAADILVSNGLIHEIEGVLVPESITAAPSDVETSTEPSAAPSVADTSTAPSSVPSAAETSTAPSSTPSAADVSSVPSSSVSPTQPVTPTTLLTAVVDTPELSTLETAAVLAGEPVTGPLGDTSLSLTAFAPNDDAFTAAGLDAYLEPDFILHLRDLLLYHVHGAEILAADIPGGETELTMLNGASDVVTVRGGRVVTVTDTQGNRYDVIAPDAAIVDNGVAHIIDGVLLPSWAGMGVATAAGMVERFSILAQAVTAAGLGETLDNTMGITVFAPNNDAFAAALPGLGFESADELLAETELLTSVLQYHAIAVVARSEILTDGMMVDSLLEGESLTINVGEGVTVNGISVVAADILVSNGLIHEIEGVLVPESITAAPSEAAPTVQSDFPSSSPSLIPTAAPSDFPSSTPSAAPNTGVTADPTPEPTSYTLLNAVVDSEVFSTLADAAVLAGEEVTDVLSNPLALLTVFAPTDDAFMSANLGTYLEPGYILHLRDLLLYHVHGSEITSDLVFPGSVSELTMSNGAPDIVTVTGLDDGGITVTDSIGNIFGVSIPDAALVDNGVAHAIDGVLLPAWAGLGVAGVAGTVSRFSLLVGAAVSLELTDVLDNTMGITVFAPNDAAFLSALNELGLVPATFTDETELAESVLQYHVVSGVFPSSSLTDGMVLPTLLDGESLTVNIGSNGVTVNDIDVIATDILTKNGLIHEINGVLLPESILNSPPPTPAPSAPSAASSLASFGAMVAGAAFVL